MPDDKKSEMRAAGLNDRVDSFRGQVRETLFSRHMGKLVGIQMGNQLERRRSFIYLKPILQFSDFVLKIFLLGLFYKKLKGIVECIR